ncbi:DUF421 domain-containing protein [Heliobacterium undosum]|uniref:DUF421 domain-containing protein n=2 Tax=Heliomicrobium undosum TaxID=121734 RepID=A0A845L3W3_9FIRM|nr:DUF421 domain-containing protein [Heliomicrobium undosum]
MTYFDFVIAIVMGTIAGAYVVTEVKGAWVLLSPVVLTIATVATSMVHLKSLAARKILEGEPVIVVQNGKVMEENMKRLRYSLDKLEMQLRNKGAFNITDVEFALLEPNGKLSVLKKSQHLPVTMSDLGKPTAYKGLATEIIKDGDVLEQNLLQHNLSFKWLYGELKKRGVEDLSEVFYAALQSDGTLYVDVRRDGVDGVHEVEDKLE